MKKTRSFTLFFITLVALCVVVWLFSPTVKKIGAKRPAETRRAIEFKENQKKSRPLPAKSIIQKQEVNETSIPSITINVFLYRADSNRYPISTGLDIGPQHYLPMLDEAPWPDLDSVDALQKLAEEMRSPSFVKEETYDQFMETAEQDGLFDSEVAHLAEDPWLGLTAMYARYGREVTDTLRKETDLYKNTADMARALIDKYPDEPVGDYARLLLLHTMNENEQEGELNEKNHYLLEILQGSEDNLVIQATLEELNQTKSINEDPEIERWLDANVTDLDPEVAEVVAIGRLSHFSELNQQATTQKWISRYADILDDKCLDQDCGHYLYEFTEFEARMNANWKKPANSWKSAIIQHIYECHAARPITTNIDGELLWTGETWSPSPNLNMCASHLNHTLGPLRKTKVRLNVISAID